MGEKKGLGVGGGDRGIEIFMGERVKRRLCVGGISFLGVCVNLF